MDCFDQPKFWIIPLLGGSLIGMCIGILISTLIFLKYMPIAELLRDHTMMLKAQMLRIKRGEKNESDR